MIKFFISIIVAGFLFTSAPTKYLNHVFVIERGQYTELGSLLIAATIIGFVVPVFAILVLGRRI